MQLDNFYLCVFDEGNVEHKTVVVELANDLDGSRYLGDLMYGIEMIKAKKKDGIRGVNECYIAYYGDVAVAFISLTTLYNSYQISYGVRPKYRGEYLGSLLLQEFSEKVFETYDYIDELTLIISNLNTGSRKVASLAGYKQVNKNKYIQKR